MLMNAGIISDSLETTIAISYSKDSLLSDLPDELMAELSISDSDKAEFAIVGLIDENGGIASLARSPRLERLSVVGFAATCLAIVLHGLARAVYALRRRRSKHV